jgi:hypothetical protein
LCRRTYYSGNFRSGWRSAIWSDALYSIII